jgi:hypothetical protein
MDIGVASIFLSAALLMGTGIAFLGIVIVFLNNIIHRYWKNLNWFKFLDFTDEKRYPPTAQASVNPETEIKK